MNDQAFLELDRIHSKRLFHLVTDLQFRQILEIFHLVKSQQIHFRDHSSQTRRNLEYQNYRNCHHWKYFNRWILSNQVIWGHHDTWLISDLIPKKSKKSKFLKFFLLRLFRIKNELVNSFFLIFGWYGIFEKLQKLISKLVFGLST